MKNKHIWYEVFVYSNGGKQTLTSFDTLEEAINFRNKYQRENRISCFIDKWAVINGYPEPVEQFDPEIKKPKYIHKTFCLGWFRFSFYWLEGKFSLRFSIEKGWE